jgi:hypothetical protein
LDASRRVDDAVSSPSPALAAVSDLAELSSLGRASPEKVDAAAPLASASLGLQDNLAAIEQSLSNLAPVQRELERSRIEAELESSERSTIQPRPSLREDYLDLSAEVSVLSKARELLDRPLSPTAMDKERSDREAALRAEAPLGQQPAVSIRLATPEAQPLPQPDAPDAAELPEQGAAARSRVPPLATQVREAPAHTICSVHTQTFEARPAPCEAAPVAKARATTETSMQTEPLPKSDFATRNWRCLCCLAVFVASCLGMAVGALVDWQYAGPPKALGGAS